jgi:hypothetical protein
MTSINDQCVVAFDRRDAVLPERLADGPHVVRKRLRERGDRTGVLGVGRARQRDAVDVGQRERIGFHRARYEQDGCKQHGGYRGNAQLPALQMALPAAGPDHP